jgi:hypothetical protein
MVFMVAPLTESPFVAPAAEEPDARSKPAAWRLHLALPGVLVGVLSFQAGGFFPAATAWLAALLAVGLALRVLIAERPFEGWSWALAAATAAIALFAVWTLASASWSDAPFRAAVEFDRALAYGLTLCLLGSFARRDGDLERLLRWVALVIALVAAAALATWLLPGWFPSEPGKDAQRLAFPLTYWNALGILCSVGFVLSLHLTAGGRQPVAVRLAGAGACPLLLTALYFTFSRGAIVAAMLGTVVYVALAHSRRLLTASLAVVPPTTLAVGAAYGTDSLTTARAAIDNPDAQRLAWVLGFSAIAAVVLRGVAVLGDRRLDGIRISRRRRRRLLACVAASVAAVLLVVSLAADVPQRLDSARRTFVSDAPSPATGRVRDRLTRVNSSGRYKIWRVAGDVFAAHPLLGTGAGTFALQWEQQRRAGTEVVDAHFLGLEILSELGVAGLLMLLVGLGIPLAIALQRLIGRERQAHAAFLAAALALLAHAEIDWDWEMPALFVWFFGAAGVVCSGRRRGARSAALGRPLRIVAALGCVVVALMPVSVALSERELRRANSAFARGDCSAAIDAALASLERFGARPEPFELLGYCDLRGGRPDLAIGAMGAARRRDPRNWTYAYGDAIALAIAGRDPLSALGEARRRNPRSRLPRELVAAFKRKDASRWRQVAANARIPVR